MTYTTVHHATHLEFLGSRDQCVTSEGATDMELNEKSIKAAKPGDVLKDRDISGLHMRCFEQSKGYYLYFRTKAGAQRKPKLGDHGTLTLAQARKVAKDMLGEVGAGGDPSADRVAARKEPTVTDLWGELWLRHASTKKSSAQMALLWRKHIEPRLGRLKLSEVKYKDIANMMGELAATPYGANRTLALMSKMFNFGIRPLEWLDRNPCKGVVRFKEEKRKRYMVGEEASKIAELLDASAKESPASVAFIYLLILTGARCGEIAGAKWAWLNGNVLSLPDSKTGAKSVYLPPQALDVLERLPRTSGTITGIQSPKKLWERVRRDAGCPDLRLHDLRHSFASAALAAGLSLAQIGELLGHKSTQTTHRYAHLVEDVATAAATATADRIMLGMKKAPAEAEAKVEVTT